MMPTLPPAGSTDEATTGDGVSVDPTVVVWWRQRVTTAEVPRTHRFGWSVLGSGRHREWGLVSPHLRLDRATIQRELSVVLAAELGVAVRVVPAADCMDQLDRAMQLAVAGHSVCAVDLASAFGLDVIGGVTAELLGHGVSARVIVETTLSSPIRDAVLDWAAKAIDHFVNAAGDELIEAGWQQLTYTRWQLLAVQTGQRHQAT